MKRILVALAFCSMAGVAAAQDEDETLPPVVVEHVSPGRIIFDCEPPNGAPECARFHELIRENFTPREIGMLFGASSAYFEYPVNYDRTRERYIAFLQDLQNNGMPVPVSDQDQNNAPLPMGEEDQDNAPLPMDEEDQDDVPMPRDDDDQ